MTTRYFQGFDIVNYRFGDNEPSALFQNLSTYVDLIDQLKSNVSFYEDYTIVSGDRPDTTSFKLYDTDEYYWTFYLLNDKLRESGWPLKREEILDIARERYPHRMVTTKDRIGVTDKAFRVGQVVTGVTSGTVGTVIKRNLDLGQLVIDTTNTVVSSDREFTIEPNTNGFVTVELTADTEKFTNQFLWTIEKDGVAIEGFRVSLGRLSKVAEIRDIVYEEGSTYVLTATINTSNPTDNSFLEGEIISYPTGEGSQHELEVFKESAQYDAVHHYERKTYTAFNLDTLETVLTSYDRTEARRAAESLDNGELRETVEWVDIDPYTQVVPTGAVPVTYLERLDEKNNDLKQIKVLKPDVVEELAENFYRKIREVV